MLEKEIEEARQALGFVGSVKLEPLDRDAWIALKPESDEAITLSTGPPWEHKIKFPSQKQIDLDTFYHEICHVILNEKGFQNVLTLSKEKLAKRSKTGNEQTWKLALFLVAETYAEWISFAIFRIERLAEIKEFEIALSRRGAISNAFETEGKLGVAMLLSFRTTFAWFGPPPSIQRPYSTSKEGKALQSLEPVFIKLPRLSLAPALELITGEKLESIASAVVELYEILTS